MIHYTVETSGPARWIAELHTYWRKGWTPEVHAARPAEAEAVSSSIPLGLETLLQTVPKALKPALRSTGLRGSPVVAHIFHLIEAAAECQ